MDEVPMLWTIVVLLHMVVVSERDRRRARSLAPTALGRRLGLLRAALAAYSVTATAVYFSRGFVWFVVAYGASVVALVALAARAIFDPSGGPRSDAPRRLLVTAAATYAAGFVLLWLPGELLCAHVPLMKRLPMHALFHLTSAAGPHLGLTAFALARHEEERPTAPRSLLFGWLPAIERGHKAV